MAIHRDVETSSLNESSRRFNSSGANRRTGITAQTVVKTLGKVIFIIGLIVLALYVLTDQMVRKSCNDSDLSFAPLIEKNGILELSWDSLPTAIRTVSNLAIIEHNSQCGLFNFSLLRSLTCDYLTLAYMPHSSFSFRYPSGCASSTNGKTPTELPAAHPSPCFGLRWIANRLDTFHGPFTDLNDLKRWFNAVTSPEYIGCLGKPGTRLNDLTSSIQQQTTNLTAP